MIRMSFKDCCLKCPARRGGQPNPSARYHVSENPGPRYRSSRRHFTTQDFARESVLNQRNRLLTVRNPCCCSPLPSANLYCSATWKSSQDHLREQLFPG